MLAELNVIKSRCNLLEAVYTNLNGSTISCKYTEMCCLLMKIAFQLSDECSSTLNLDRDLQLLDDLQGTLIVAFQYSDGLLHVAC